MSKAKTAAAPKKAVRDFDAVFARLKGILEPYKDGWIRKEADSPPGFYLETACTAFRGKPLWFGGVRMGKSYVSFYLMAVYAVPELRKRISPALKKRMQGKACFNFTAVDEVLFSELEELTASGAKRFLSEEFLRKLAEGSFKYT